MPALLAPPGGYAGRWGECAAMLLVCAPCSTSCQGTAAQTVLGLLGRRWEDWGEWTVLALLGGSAKLVKASSARASLCLPWPPLNEELVKSFSWTGIPVSALTLPKNAAPVRRTSTPLGWYTATSSPPTSSSASATAASSSSTWALRATCAPAPTTAPRRPSWTPATAPRRRWVSVWVWVG